MVDFRKWFLVLVALALVAVPMSADPYSCVTNPGQPPIIRDGGLAELVGDVVLQCSGSAPLLSTATNITTNIQIFLSPAQVTNRVKAGVTATECPTGIACVTDSFLLVTDQFGALIPQNVGQATNPYVGPVVGLLQSNLTTGDAANTRNSILFPNVTLPYGTLAFIRITNVRVAAPVASNTSLPTQVFELVSTNPVGAFPITNPTQTVAYVLPGLQFAVKSCTDGGAPSLTFPQCVTKSAGTLDFNVKFTEGFALAFKTRGLQTQTQVGTVYNTESGLTINGTAIGGTAWTGNTASYADSGTKLIVRFTNIPQGVNIWVTNNPSFNGTSGAVAGATVPYPLINAVLVDPTSTATGTATCGSSYAIQQVPITAGAGSATWEITTAAAVTGGGALGAQKSISFGVVVAYTSNTTAGLPGLTGSTPGAVSGGFAPISSVDSASTTAAIPRFRDNAIGATVFNIGACASNLLFPFVTNQGGFDTGIALVNTSLDNAGSSLPFKTNTQSGTCTVYYFNGLTTAPAAQITPVIPAGGMNAFTIQGGGVVGSTSSAQGFQGYIIARCNFQYAHGFAFISDRNTPTLGSQGYLALVIPDRTREASPMSTSIAGSGEQLVN